MLLLQRTASSRCAARVHNICGSVRVACFDSIFDARAQRLNAEESFRLDPLPKGQKMHSVERKSVQRPT